MPFEFANEPVKLSLIHETAQRELTALLDRQIGCSATKPALVFAERSILSIFNYCGFAKDGGPLTKEHGIAKVMPVSDEFPVVPVAHIVYFVRPHIQSMAIIAAHALAFTEHVPKAAVTIVFVPKRTLLCEHALVQEFHLREKVAKLAFEDFDLDMVPLDEDLISMEMPTVLRDVLLNGDVTPLSAIARGIVKLQTARFGPIPRIRAKGPLATKVLQIVQRLQENELGKAFVEEEAPEIEQLFIIDRTVDLLTPMMTQLTYEGLIAELYAIDMQSVPLPREPGVLADPEVAADSATSSSTGRPLINLNANDRMFAEIRDVNFTRVGVALREKSVYVKEVYEKKNDKSMGLRELQEFITNLPAMQELHRCIGVHTTIATSVGTATSAPDFRKQVGIEQAIIEQKDEARVVEYIEELINKSAPLHRVMRLIALFSIVSGGLKGKYFEPWRESVGATYGIPQAVAMWEAFETAGLLARANQQFSLTSQFENKRRICRLWDTLLDEKNPQDYSFAYSGYASLLVRQLEAMGLCGGPVHQEVLDQAPGDFAEVSSDMEVQGNTRITMIFVVGGVTHAELSSLRFLNRRMQERGEARRFVFATTSVLTGTKLLDSMMAFRVVAKPFVK